MSTHVDLELFRNYHHTVMDRDVVLIHHDRALDIWTYRVIDAAPYGEIKQASAKQLSGELAYYASGITYVSELTFGEALAYAFRLGGGLQYLMNGYGGKERFFLIKPNGRLEELRLQCWEDVPVDPDWFTQSTWTVLRTEPAEFLKRREFYRAQFKGYCQPNNVLPVI